MCLIDTWWDFAYYIVCELKIIIDALRHFVLVVVRYWCVFANTIQLGFFVC